jgi:hypothetical protein
MVGSRAICEVCRQPKWVYDLNEYGQKIQIGVWEDGGPKFKVHGHQCSGPNYMTAAPQKVDKLYQKTNEAIKYVEDRAQSNHVNIHGMAADLALVKEDVQTCKQHLETLVKKAGMFQAADTMVTRPIKDHANMGPPPKRPELKPFTHNTNEQDYADETATNATSFDSGDGSSEENEVLEEIAETDDTTHPDDTKSINFINAPEVVEGPPSSSS